MEEVMMDNIKLGTNFEMDPAAQKNLRNWLTQLIQRKVT
jgi:hypothetical protein